jgi:hypothetical protein
MVFLILFIGDNDRIADILKIKFLNRRHILKYTAGRGCNYLKPN